MYLPDLGEAFEDAYERAGIDPASLVAQHFTSARRSLAGLFIDLKTQGIAEHQLDYWSVDVGVGVGAVSTPDDTVDITDLVIRRNPADVLFGDIPLSRTSKERWLGIARKEASGVPTEWWLSREWSKDAGALLDANGAFSTEAYGTDPAVDPGTRAGPILVLHPVPDRDYTLLGFRVRATEDMVKAADLLPVRQAWTEAIIAGLALRLYEKRGDKLDQTRLKVLGERAGYALRNAKSFDRNRDPTVIAGNFRNWRTRRL